MKLKKKIVMKKRKIREQNNSENFKTGNKLKLKTDWAFIEVEYYIFDFNYLDDTNNVDYHSEPVSLFVDANSEEIIKIDDSEGRLSDDEKEKLKQYFNNIKHKIAFPDGISFSPQSGKISGDSVITNEKL